MCRAGFFVAVFYVELLLSQLFAVTASQGELLAQPPPWRSLGHPTRRLRVRCVARFIGKTSPATQKLVARLLRHPMTLFPDKSALLARVNGTNSMCTLHHRCFRKQPQTNSMATAVASPPPMHSEATPRLPPVCCRALIRVMMMREPVEPTGWPWAQAPP